MCWCLRKRRVSSRPTSKTWPPPLRRTGTKKAAGARPTAGVKGRVYHATDTKRYSVDTGTAWNELLSATAVGSYSTKTYTKAEAEAEVEPSATRVAFVNLVTTSSSWTGGVAVYVGAPATHEAGRIGELKNDWPASTAIMVPPGQKWKTTQPVEVFTVLR